MKKKSPPAAKPQPTPSETRSGETRRPIERIFTIHEAILRGRYPNCRRLSEKIGVTQKTIQRDITFMQNDLGCPSSMTRSSTAIFIPARSTTFP